MWASSYIHQVFHLRGDAIAGLKPKFGERLRVAPRKRDPREASRGFEKKPALSPFDRIADFF